MEELLTTLLQAVLTVTVPVITAFAVRFLNAKAGEAKGHMNNETAVRYLTEAAEAVETAVLHTAQTYVDGLKASDKWTKENQKEALSMAIKEAKFLLTEEAEAFLGKAYGDLNNYLTAKIEAEVKALE